MKVASHPFAPGHIIFNRNLIASYLNNFFSLAGYMGIIFYVPLYFQAVDSMSATQAGLRLIPGLLCSVSGSLFAGIYMKKTGKYYWLTIVCLCLYICGSVIIFLSSGLLLSKSWFIIFGLCISAFGGGASIVTTLINVIANADPKDQAIATACTYLFRSLGSVVGVSISATIVQQRLRTLLRDNLEGGEADEIVEKVRQSLDFIKTLDGHTRMLVVNCYQQATNTAFGIGIVIVFAALVSTCFMREAKLSK
jgi:MFS family permease